VDWRQMGSCADQDPELFFPIGTGPAAGGQVQQAKAVCGRCPVSMQCLQWAMDTQQQGVWGGMTDDERRRLSHRKGRAPHRPSASARAS
jgi:WhiB family redox-sensing transcriptional regulator